jgi:hypothetical protein
VSCSYEAHSRRVGRRSRELLRQSTVFWWRKRQRVWLLRNRVGPWWQCGQGRKSLVAEEFQVPVTLLCVSS